MAIYIKTINNKTISSEDKDYYYTLVDRDKYDKCLYIPHLIKVDDNGKNDFENYKGYKIIK